MSAMTLLYIVQLAMYYKQYERMCMCKKVLLTVIIIFSCVDGRCISALSIIHSVFIL